MWSWCRSLWQRWLGKLGLTPPPLGRRGEQFAAVYLRKQGWRIYAAGHRTRWSELDLVAQDGDVVVFVEVKTRRSEVHGRPDEAVTREKQRRITQAAASYLKQQGWLDRRSRFDVISVVWHDPAVEPTLTHYRHAFEATGHGQFYS